MLARRERLERALGELAEASPWAATINRLRCLRGIDTLSAVGLQAEIGDFQRFAHPKQLAGYLGLVPSEHTSGEQRRQGAITKAGSKHARRLLVEAAWHYRLPPRMSTTLERRQRGQDPRASTPPGAANGASTSAGNGSTPSAASAARSARSRSHASSRASAGRSAS